MNLYKLYQNIAASYQRIVPKWAELDEKEKEIWEDLQRAQKQEVPR